MSESTMHLSRHHSRWFRGMLSASGTMVLTKLSRSFPCLRNGLVPHWLAKPTLITHHPALGFTEAYHFEIPDQGARQRRSGASWRSCAGKSGRNTLGVSRLPQAPRTRMRNADALQTPRGDAAHWLSLLAPRRSRQSMSSGPHLRHSRERTRPKLL